jgi:hypothetical protein
LCCLFQTRTIRRLSRELFFWAGDLDDLLVGTSERTVARSSKKPGQPAHALGCVARTFSDISGVRVLFACWCIATRTRRLVLTIVTALLWSDAAGEEKKKPWAVMDRVPASVLKDFHKHVSR